MFVREKRIGPYTYVYLVETVRENGKTRQRTIHTLGRKEDVERRGARWCCRCWTRAASPS